MLVVILQQYGSPLEAEKLAGSDRSDWATLLGLKYSTRLGRGVSGSSASISKSRSIAMVQQIGEIPDGLSTTMRTSELDKV